MCFDKNERRLVTAGGDGTVFMWNFNNGSKLREYAHDDERMELVTVGTGVGRKGIGIRGCGRGDLTLECWTGCG